MFFSDKEKGNVIIGEAAFALILARQEVSVESLIQQLKVMAGTESDQSRLLKIEKAKAWLTDFRSVSNRKPAQIEWLVGQRNVEESADHSSNDIHLNKNDKDA